VFHPDHAGRGFATEAVGTVIRTAFEVFGMHRVVARMDARNTSSARLCERLGMTREAHLRQDLWSKDEWTDVVVYGLLSSEVADLVP
jgi:RimJ/RimL family protein N-acetyltransferase